MTEQWFPWPEPDRWFRLRRLVCRLRRHPESSGKDGAIVVRYCPKCHLAMLYIGDQTEYMALDVDAVMGQLLSRAVGSAHGADPLPVKSVLAALVGTTAQGLAA